MMICAAGETIAHPGGGIAGGAGGTTLGHPHRLVCLSSRHVRRPPLVRSIPPHPLHTTRRGRGRALPEPLQSCGGGGEPPFALGPGTESLVMVFVLDGA